MFWERPDFTNMGSWGCLCCFARACLDLPLYHGGWAFCLFWMVAKSSSRWFTECFYSSDYCARCSISLLERQWNSDKQKHRVSISRAWQYIHRLWIGQSQTCIWKLQDCINLARFGPWLQRTLSIFVRIRECSPLGLIKIITWSEEKKAWILRERGFNKRIAANSGIVDSNIGPLQATKQSAINWSCQFSQFVPQFLLYESPRYFITGLF